MSMTSTITPLLTGTVLEIQRMSTEDGPGIRTTVFMKGCPMHCLWCHNPESISPKPQVQWFAVRCIGCKTCLATCPNHALMLTNTGMVIDREKCEGCGQCAEACPTCALEMLGKTWQVDDLVAELMKDETFFRQSNGGITISGGEATHQWQFVGALAAQLKQRGIHLTLDTCGISSQTALAAILPFTDLVLFDLKEMDADKHRQFTGCPLETVKSSLLKIAEIIRAHELPTRIWVRTPLIPQATARDDNISAIGQFIATHIADLVERWDLLAFNNLCKDKYERLGLTWQFADCALLTRATMEAFTKIAVESCGNPALVRWSGSTRLEDAPALPQEPAVYPSPCC